MIYYNENDTFAADWLENLIADGRLPAGYVDRRDIRDVRPSDLDGYAQCHFFAGIGGWPLALAKGGWPADRLVWTGSCPCQPFSSAGRRKGVVDERHLWPHWFHLIGECRPSELFGEQVASKDGLGWLDLVQADLETAGYAFGAADMCAAGFGAPHIRQRLWFHARTVGRLANVPGIRQCSDESRPDCRNSVVLERTRAGRDSVDDGKIGGLADSSSQRLPKRECDRQIQQEALGTPPGETFIGESDVSWLADDQGAERQQSWGTRHRWSGETSRANPTDGLWRDADWLFCRDGKWRPVEPGSFPLAHGVPDRMGKLRGFGNAIVVPVAAAFVEACL